MKIPIGIRQNNAGNIRRTSDNWDGLTVIQKGDFFTFKSPKYGYRSMARILRNYQKRGLNTLSKIISTWAPSIENDTNSYLAHVVSQTGIDANEPIDVNDHLPALLEAIAKHENGTVQWELRHDKQMILDGIALA